jgi:hypothetical protein
LDDLILSLDEEVTFNIKSTSEYVVADVLKAFLQALPEPILTYGLYDILLEEVKAGNVHWAWNAKFYINNLSVHHKAILARLMEFLKKMNQNENHNGYVCVINLVNFIKDEHKHNCAALWQSFT